MNNLPEVPLTRKRVGVRLLYTILFLIILHVVKTIISLIALFQFVYLLLALKYSEPGRQFSNRLSVYQYQVMRYLTLCDNQRPFPFQEFPGELEATAPEVTFD
jgi:D-alanyl-lipoteichoic acid acyltransferase DltB (MBOAT superfamily)